MLPNARNRIKRPRYRPISPADTIQTTGQQVNPVGSIVPYSDPLSASYGPQGTFGAMLPTVNVTNASTPNWGAGGLGNLPGYYGTAGTPVAQTYTSGPFSLYKVGNPFEQYQYTPSSRPPAGVTGPAGRGPGAAVLAQQQGNVVNATNTSSIPPTGSFSTSRAQYEVLNRLEQGDINMLSQIPKADLDALGLTDIANSVQQSNTQSGRAPFGTNASGQRLDAYGNIWDPSTATTDIYGHAFKGQGQFDPVNRAKRKAWREAMARQARGSVAKPKQTTNGFTGSYGVVNFNTGNG